MTILFGTRTRLFFGPAISLTQRQVKLSGRGFVPRARCLTLEECFSFAYLEHIRAYLSNTHICCTCNNIYSALRQSKKKRTNSRSFKKTTLRLIVNVMCICMNAQECNSSQCSCQPISFYSVRLLCYYKTGIGLQPRLTQYTFILQTKLSIAV